MISTSNKMKTWFLLTFLFTIISIPFIEAQDTSVILNRRIPVVTISDINGNVYNTVKMSNEGRPFIIVFWKTCCKPPIRELSVLNDLYEEWKQNTGVKIYAVSIDDARATKTVKPFTDGQGWEFEVLLDPNQELKRNMNVYGVPHTFVLNGQGEIVGQKVLYSEGDENDIYKMILESLPKH